MVYILSSCEGRECWVMIPAWKRRGVGPRAGTNKSQTWSFLDSTTPSVAMKTSPGRDVFLAIMTVRDSRVDIQTWSGLVCQVWPPQLSRQQTLYKCTLCTSVYTEYSRQNAIKQSTLLTRHDDKQELFENSMGRGVQVQYLVSKFFWNSHRVSSPGPVSRWHSVVRVAGFKPVGAEKRSGSIPPSGRTFCLGPGPRNTRPRARAPELSQLIASVLR